MKKIRIGRREENSSFTTHPATPNNRAKAFALAHFPFHAGAVTDCHHRENVTQWCECLMDYDVYHDESKEAGYWHGILLVPQKTREQLVDKLQKLRDNTGYKGVIQLKGLDKTGGKRYRCTRAWLSLGVAALIQNLKGTRYPFYTGMDARNPGFDLLEAVIGAKFILFKVRDDHRDMEGYRDYGAKVETTFRMGLKGGLHLFADETSLVSVRSFHFDGHEHYRRRIDATRIIERLGTLRQQVHVSQDAPIDDRSSDHTKGDCQEYDDCQILQLTDLLVGGFRTVLGYRSNEAQGEVSKPLCELADRWHDGYARMKNSRWFKGFCISECYLENGEWNFTDIHTKVPDTQLTLPDLWT